MLTNGRYTYYDLLHVHLLMDEDAEEIGQPVHEGRAWGDDVGVEWPPLLWRRHRPAIGRPPGEG